MLLIVPSNAPLVDCPMTKHVLSSIPGALSVPSQLPATFEGLPDDEEGEQPVLMAVMPKNAHNVEIKSR
jgi:hypothetical protein